MEYSNLNYLFEHLPARVRRDDGGPQAPLDYFNPGAFAALSGTTFRVFPEGVDLTLTGVTQIGAEQFSLQFSGPVNAIASGTKIVTHPLLGGFELFVSPIDFSSLGHYEAAFNRMPPPPLPAFLRRFLLFFALTLDGWDLMHERFYQMIAPATAPEAFVTFWLWALFDWSWYPRWFTLARKRLLYADFAQHLARRGTARGIEEFLKAFSVFARVYNRPQYWGEFAWGTAGWTITDAMGVVIQVDHVADEVNFDRGGQGWGEFAWGEGGSYFADTLPTLTRREIEDLCRFEWPMGQRVMIEYRRRRNVAGPDAWSERELLLNNFVPPEDSAPLTDWI